MLVLIASLKAAAVGLNLVAANYVVLLDLWWNPTIEQQAIDRAHRIGEEAITYSHNTQRSSPFPLSDHAVLVVLDCIVFYKE